MPECVLSDADTGAVYVSNVEAGEGEYWSDDGRASLTCITVAGQRIDTWLASGDGGVLDAPKGMCLLNGMLYIADNTRLLSCRASDATGLREVASGFVKANDLATDGRSIWLSDLGAGVVWCISPDGSSRRQIPAPASVNGLAFDGPRLYAVSWELHDVFELDPTGVAKPVPFGLAESFANLDGIEVLPDGSFIVSDFVGNKIFAVTPDRKQVTPLADVDTPADIGINRRQKRLYVPSFAQDRVTIYHISGGGL